MERVAKLKKLSDTRRLLRLCFTRLPSASQVPLEVWRDNVVLETDLCTMTMLAQTCKAFWELVEEIRRCNVRVALVYRQYDQIPLARRCLEMCAYNGVAEAMFHMGYSLTRGGFGVVNNNYNTEWIQKAAEAGSYIAMALHATYGPEDEFKYWIDRVLSSNDNLAIGYYYLYASSDVKKALPFLEKSAKEGNEHGQYWLFDFYLQRGYVQPEEYMWLEKAAKQGLYTAQNSMGCTYSYWAKRSEKQLH
jgi:TPR repeat protein